MPGGGSLDPTGLRCAPTPQVINDNTVNYDGGMDGGMGGMDGGMGGGGDF